MPITPEEDISSEANDIVADAFEEMTPDDAARIRMDRQKSKIREDIHSLEQLGVTHNID